MRRVTLDYEKIISGIVVGLAGLGIEVIKNKIKKSKQPKRKRRKNSS